MPLTADYMRGALRLAKEVTAPAVPLGLRAWMLVEMGRLHAATQDGQVLISTSEAGHSATYSSPGAGSATTQDMFGFWSSMVDLYDDCEAALIAAGDADPDEDDIYATMLPLIFGATVISSQFGSLAR